MTIVSALFPVLAATTDVGADDFKLIPEGSIREEYNDNVFFSTGQRLSSFITTLSTGLTLIQRTERFSAKADLHLDGLLYTADDDLNSADHRYRALLDYRLTPLSKVGLTAGFTHASRPDRLIETAGQIVNQDSDHQQYSLSGETAVSEKITGVTTYVYESTDYSNPELSDVEGHNLALGLNYDLDDIFALLKGHTSLGYSTSRYSRSRTENITATTGISYRFHELWSADADLGLRYTHSRFQSDGSGERRNDNAGIVASLRTVYQGEINSGEVTLSESVQNSAGRSGSVELTALTFQLGHSFSAELKGAFGCGYYYNRSGKNEFAAQLIDEITVRCNPSLRYEFSPDLVLDAFYEHAMVRYREIDADARRNKVFLRLTFQKPFFE